MRTQKHDLKDEIKRLEKDLQYAVLNLDAFTQLSINFFISILLVR